MDISMERKNNVTRSYFIYDECWGGSWFFAWKLGKSKAAGLKKFRKKPAKSIICEAIPIIIEKYRKIGS